MLWTMSETLLSLVALIGMLITAELGFRLGRRWAGRGDPDLKAHVDALQAALMGLLALILGFTFSMAITRFEARKQLVLDEANAIGTAYLRTDLLPDASRQSARQLLRSYVDARLDFFVAGIDNDRIAAANVEAARLQQAIWAEATRLSRAAPEAVSLAQYVESINALIDLGEARLRALENHIPESVILLGLGLSCATLGFIGFGSGIVGRRRARSVSVVAVLLVLVLSVILDLDRPRRGMIRVSQASLIALQKQFAGVGNAQ